MVCNNCGRQINNEEANFCEYCGYSFRDRGLMQEVVKPAPTNPLLPNQPAAVQEKEAKPLSFLSFLGSYGIFFIPVIGTLLFPIMLLVWSFSSRIHETKKNWARATLIFFILFFFYMAYMMLETMMIPAMQEFIKGNIDSGELIRQLREYYGS